MDKMTLFFYGALLAGVLTVTTFVFTVILVPAWNWVATLPAAIKSAATAKPAKTPAPNYQPVQIQAQTAAAIAPEKTPKPADCGKIIRQIKAGNAVSLPTECEQTYQAVKEQEQAKLEEQKQKDELKQKELDRQTAERENAAKLELERQRDVDRQQEENRQRQEAEAMRAANAERERQRQEADDRRRQEAKDEAARREAQRLAAERERGRQQELQKRNDALIRLGNDIRNKIFRRNR